MATSPVQTLSFLGGEYGMDFYEGALRDSSEGSDVHRAMLEMGLTPDVERTQLFSVYSPESRKSIAISVTPYNSDDQRMEGGLSLSEGGHAQAVVVYLRNKVEIDRFTTLAIDNEGHLVKGDFSAEELAEIKARKLVRQSGRVKTAQPLVEITSRQARSISSLTFNTLLGDEKSRTVHSDKEIRALRANSSIVSEISQFVLLRTQGSACCSCSCSCWGSSSCSCSYAG